MEFLCVPHLFGSPLPHPCQSPAAGPGTAHALAESGPAGHPPPPVPPRIFQLSLPYFSLLHFFHLLCQQETIKKRNRKQTETKQKLNSGLTARQQPRPRLAATRLQIAHSGRRTLPEWAGMQKDAALREQTLPDGGTCDRGKRQYATRLGGMREQRPG